MSKVREIRGAVEKLGPQEGAASLREVPSPYKTDVWRHLAPGERLRRSWQMRSRLPDLKAAHDRKLFPKP
jgi:hypothetical protein